MNKNLIQFNMDSGISIDENGDVKSLLKKENAYSLKEVLENENTLELLKKDLTEIKGKYSDTKKTINNIRICDIITIFGSALLALLLHFFLVSPLIITLIGALLFAGFGKTTSLMMFGSKIKNKKNLRKLNNRRHELENKIPYLERKIGKMKKEVGFSAIPKRKNQEIVIDDVKTQSKENGTIKVKVLKLN